MNKRPILFQNYPKLKGKIPFKSFGDYPSKVEKLKELSKKTDAEIWIKRDDSASPIYGGNKCRMMEFIIADATEKGRKSLVTWGAIGSNQVLSSVIYGRREGFSDIVAVHNEQPYQPYITRNFLISTSLGVKQVLGGNSLSLVSKLGWEYLKRKLGGKCPYLIPLVGSSPISVLSYFDAALELREQIKRGECPKPDYIFVTVGTGGTAAGLMLGSFVLGDIGVVIGVRVLERVFVNEKMISWEINRTISFLRGLGVDLGVEKVRAKDIHLIHDYIGAGYAESTTEAVSAIRLLDELEDITLDITYTGKTMAAMLDFTKGNKDKKFLFWHTLNTVDISKYTDNLPDISAAPSCFHKHLKG